MRSDGLFVAVLVGVPVAAGVVFAAVAGALAWSWAPPVAGDWFPYIRAGVALVVGLVGLKVGLALGAVVSYGVLVSTGSY